MKVRLRATAVLVGIGVLAVSTALAAFWGTPASEILGAGPLPRSHALAIVSHRWEVTVAASNHVAIRPGSVYDIVTYFEQNLGTRPRFNYRFLDTGLGAADPLYPVFQRGQQAGWGQLLPAMWSARNRHIDHESVVDTPDGCRVRSSYWVRHIDDFPERYAEARAAGYTLVDISFNHYTRLRADAQCGRHRSEPPDPGFEPIAAIRPYAARFRSFADVPPELLARYEAKIGLLRLVSEEFDRSKWPRFEDSYSFEENSLWYYPQGASIDYGVQEDYEQPGGEPLRASDLVLPGSGRLAERFALDRVISPALFADYVRFLDGEPLPGYDRGTEPGGDARGLGEAGAGHFLTSGLELVPMPEPDRLRALVADPSRYRLVAVVVRPFQREGDRRYPAPRLVPQVRFVYQLHLPAAAGEPGRAVEQLFVHVNADAVDRYAPAPTRHAGQRSLAAALGEIAGRRRIGGDWETPAIELLAGGGSRPRVAQLGFSSALSGIWVFGALSRAYSEDGGFAPVRIVRNGVDVGYFSTVNDTVLFREAFVAASGARRAELRAHLDAITPTRYRDPRRSDPHALRFERLTCAQCHHMAGRDAVHVTVNDRLDRRFAAPVRATEFTIRELDRQLAAARDASANAPARGAAR